MIFTVWGHAPEQRVAAFTLRRYSFGLRLAIAQADARPAMLGRRIRVKGKSVRRGAVKILWVTEPSPRLEN